MKTNCSLCYAILLFALSFFPEHNVVAGESPAAALRKKATAIQVFARSTFYSHEEINEEGQNVADVDTAHFRSATQVPLKYHEEGEIGVVAVSNVHGINYGDLVITPDGRCFLAVDYGKDVKLKTASKVLALRKKISDPKYSDAPVLDFFSKSQVCGLWDSFVVIKHPGSFLRLKVSERKKRMSKDFWEPILAAQGSYDVFIAKR
jgi:hypothetical protein